MLTVLTLLATSQCNVAGHGPSDPGANGSSARLEGAHPAASGLKLAKLTPQLIAQSERLLEQHAERPVGTVIPFTLNGRRYVGRVEMHNNSAKGEHKGLTVYIPNDAPQPPDSANQE